MKKQFDAFSSFDSSLVIVYDEEESSYCGVARQKCWYNC